MCCVLFLSRSYVVVLAAVAIGVRWATNRFYLTKPWRIAGGCLLLIIAIPGLAVGVFGEGTVAFEGFSVSWFCVILVLTVLAVGFLHSEDDSKAMIRFSPHVFPVFRCVVVFGLV